MKLKRLAKDLVEMINFDDISKQRGNASFHGDNYENDDAYKPVLALAQISGELDLNSAYGDGISDTDISDLVSHRDALDNIYETEEYDKYLETKLNYNITVTRN